MQLYLKVLNIHYLLTNIFQVLSGPAGPFWVWDIFRPLYNLYQVYVKKNLKNKTGGLLLKLVTPPPTFNQFTSESFHSFLK